VIFSEFSNIDRVRNYYTKASELIPEFKRRQKEREDNLKDMDTISKDIPSLLP